MIMEQAKAAVTRYDHISAMLTNPSVAADSEQLCRLLKEQKQLEPIYSCYIQYLTVQRQSAQAQEMRKEETDEELRLLAEEEYQFCRQKEAELLSQMQILLLPRDPNDHKNVMIEIRAGAGGEEAALFAYNLYRMYQMYAQSAGFRTELISCHETELGGMKEAVFSVAGDGAFSQFKFECGVHRVQRVPETESSGRIHTSTVTVAVLPEAEAMEVEISPADIRIESMKSSGAGGQHVNKTESAVRLFHKPSGIIIECREERSQMQNREKAMRLLRTKLYDQMQTAQHDARSQARRSQVGSGDRSERIRTYNYAQGRVTDHRIGLTLYTLETILNGNIAEIIQALIAADTAERLKRADENNPFSTL